MENHGIVFLSFCGNPDIGLVLIRMCECTSLSVPWLFIYNKSTSSHNAAHKVFFFSVILRKSENPHTKNLRKSDPVARFQQFRKSWDQQKAPGEKNHKNLRWNVREQMLAQDIVYEKVRQFREALTVSIAQKGLFSTGPGSAVGNVSCNRCESDCRSRGREFDTGSVPYFHGD